MVEGKENSATPFWETTFYDPTTGGCVLVDRARIIQSRKSKNELGKFMREHNMAIVFACNGYKIEMLEEDKRHKSPDVRINGVLGEMKRTKGVGNIAKYTKDSIRNKKAEVMMFQFDQKADGLEFELAKLKRRGIKVYYFFSEEGKVYIL